jgi:predicted nucleic acid-binding protein
MIDGWGKWVLIDQQQHFNVNLLHSVTVEKDKKREQRETLLLPILNYTKNDAVFSSKIGLEAQESGNSARRTDTMIAATAINNGATVYTFDLKHFRPLKAFGLKPFP